METVSDIFAESLRHPDLWGGLFFRERDNGQDLDAIKPEEWQALGAARGHLEESIRAHLRATHSALRAAAAKKVVRSPAFGPVARAQFKPKAKAPWLKVELPLNGLSSWRASITLGFCDDLPGPIRPFVNLWTQTRFRDVRASAAEACQAVPGIESMHYPNSVAWILAPLQAGRSFDELAEETVEFIWPALSLLCRQLHKKTLKA